MTVENHEPEVRPDGVPTLRRYLQAIWRRKWIVLGALVVLPLVTLVASLTQSARYEASADVLVNRQEVATTTLVGQTPALDDAGRTMQTQAMLARVPLVIERTFAAADVTGASTYGYLSSSSVHPLGDILRFTVADDDPARAAILASEHARQYVRYRRELDTAGLAQTLEGLRRQIRQHERAGEVDSLLYERLVDNEQQLESLKSLRMSNVSVVQTAGPADAEQVAPRPRRNTAMALAAGLVVGLVLVFLWEALSTRPRSEAEFEWLLGMPMVARLRLGVPALTPLRPFDDSFPDAEAIHGLRSSLELANAAVGARTIMVTSAHSGEGKSAVAAQLAVAFARTGRHVVLVDLDFRTSSVSEVFGVGDGPGVTTVVRGECELAQALVAMSPDDGLSSTLSSNGRGDSGTLLEVVGSGPLPAAHPAELLASQGLIAMLKDLVGRADVVLVDVPPMLEATDAATVAPQLDGLLLVVDSRRARGPVLAEVRRVLEKWPVETLGFVLVDGRAPRLDARRLGRAVSVAPQRAADPERVG